MSNETRPARDKEVSDYDRARHMLPVPTGPEVEITFSIGEASPECAWVTDSEGYDVATLQRLSDVEYPRDDDAPRLGNARWQYLVSLLHLALSDPSAASLRAAAETQAASLQGATS